MSLHKEIHFETEIAEHLGAHGWIYAEGDAAGYDRARAIFPADLLAWIQESQPDAWEVLQKNHGASATETLLNRLRAQLDQRGTVLVVNFQIVQPQRSTQRDARLALQRLPETDLDVGIERAGGDAEIQRYRRVLVAARQIERLQFKLERRFAFAEEGPHLALQRKRGVVDPGRNRRLDMKRNVGRQI
jgi:hypothetical protein